MFLSVHPRGYGEHNHVYDIFVIFAGSSPWIRGTRSVRGVECLHVAVHPRGYGEHYFTKEKLNYSDGSSPWIRGTLGRYLSRKIYKRFIPVDTGNTKN